MTQLQKYGIVVFGIGVVNLIWSTNLGFTFSMLSQFAFVGIGIIACFIGVRMIMYREKKDGDVKV